MRFLWLTKVQFIILISILVVAIIACQGYLIVQTYSLADQGRESHVASCTFRGDLEKRLSDNQRFLALTQEERVAKYGPALGMIPTSVIQAGIKNQQAAIKSLSALHCN